MGSEHLRQPRRDRRPSLRLRVGSTLLTLFASFLFSAPAFAQAGGDTETAEANAAILQPGTFIRVQDMNFGDIAQPSAPGTVVLTPSATPTCNTTGGLVHTAECQAARFMGDTSFFFLLRVTKPVGGQITLAGPSGATMRVNNFTFGGTTGLANMGATATQQRYFVTSGDGRFSFHVGGTLQVAANQAAGTYTGTFALDVNFN